MSASAKKATRREIRRAFGERAVANVFALDQRLTMAEAEIVALRLKVAKLEKAELAGHDGSRQILAWASNGDEA